MGDLEPVKRIIDRLRSKPCRYGDAYLLKLEAEVEARPRLEPELSLSNFDRLMLWAARIQA